MIEARPWNLPGQAVFIESGKGGQRIDIFHKVKRLFAGELRRDAEWVAAPRLQKHYGAKRAVAPRVRTHCGAKRNGL